MEIVFIKKFYEFSDRQKKIFKTIRKWLMLPNLYVYIIFEHDRNDIIPYTDDDLDRARRNASGQV